MGLERAHYEPFVPFLRFLRGHGALWRRCSQICAGYSIFAVSYEPVRPALSPGLSWPTFECVIERQRGPADILEFAGWVVQRVGVGRRSGDKAEPKYPIRRNTVAGRRDRDKAALRGALRQGASHPRQGQMIGFGLKAYEFKPARSGVSISMKLRKP